MSSTFLARIADRVLNRPLLIHPAKAETIFGVLEGRITLDSATEAIAPEASRFKGGYKRPDGGETRFTKISGNTALISVTGSLVNRGAWIGANSGMTSYEGLAAQVDEIAGDRGIQNVVFDIDSYGGEATGMAALATKIRGLRQSKHVVAVINDVAASAGYGIASSADEIVVSPTSIVGSIGVVMLHLDRSGELQAKGIRPTLIHAGAKKVDGNPFGPLPENVRADMQKDVTAFYDQFLDVVVKGRAFTDARRKSRLTAEQAKATEADTYIGEEAIALGLADRMASLDEVLAELSRPARAAGSSSTKGKTRMDRSDLPAMDAGATDTALKASRIEGETAGKIVGKAEGVEEGKKLGATAERERIGAIMGLPEAAKRQSTALKLALDPAGFSAETVKGVLAGLPEEGATPAAAAKPGVPPVQQRAQEQTEIGASASTQVEPDAAKKGWAKAFSR